ncbi:hypothetical protein PLICRDRAFT_548317 [Plicaturopsis crispa FD-325 SS-3]|nr:hypothetical protein PLICRDRAFT_548317 [Plicaturopsis crispa FD-325 SS-3]
MPFPLLRCGSQAEHNRCNNSKCKYPNPRQTVGGTYNCLNPSCNGTYYIREARPPPKEKHPKDWPLPAWAFKKCSRYRCAFPNKIPTSVGRYECAAPGGCKGTYDVDYFEAGEAEAYYATVEDVERKERRNRERRVWEKKAREKAEMEAELAAEAELRARIEEERAKELRNLDRRAARKKAKEALAAATPVQTSPVDVASHSLPHRMGAVRKSPVREAVRPPRPAANPQTFMQGQEKGWAPLVPKQHPLDYARSQAPFLRTKVAPSLVDQRALKEQDAPIRQVYHPLYPACVNQYRR